ncbi:hypothetical protein M9H77_16208 [Catharanthus roseus]|uniref:Uncharacterized protein n=1 Tax=Catharanthus roseus TaxID=4058 RepID=A0ACC0AZN6_CATRO|nr:hypothetical protein M9H77_16208 [Catharanthus roseus]
MDTTCFRKAHKSDIKKTNLHIIFEMKESLAAKLLNDHKISDKIEVSLVYEYRQFNIGFIILIVSFTFFGTVNSCLIFPWNTLVSTVTPQEFHVANDISSIMGSFSLNEEEESHCAGLSQYECFHGCLRRWYNTSSWFPFSNVKGLEMIAFLEIYSSRHRGIGQFFRMQALLGVKKPLLLCILVQIPGSGKVKASVQYERLPIFCLFCGRIGHIFTDCDVLKNTSPRLSRDNMPFLELLGILDKMHSDISFNQNNPTTLSKHYASLSISPDCPAPNSGLGFTPYKKIASTISLNFSKDSSYNKENLLKEFFPSPVICPSPPDVASSFPSSLVITLSHLPLLISVLNPNPLNELPRFTPTGKNNMGSNNDFSYLYEPNTCLIDALNLTNGPIDDWDSNLESFSSTRDFVPSSNISIYGFECGFFVDGTGPSGGLGMFWNNNNGFFAWLLLWHIDVSISFLNYVPFRFTGFYGNPKMDHCHFSLDLLCHLHATSDLPWIVAGDLIKFYFWTKKKKEKGIICK